MIKYLNYINEQNANNLTNHDGILLIVDVQKEFENFIPQGFINALFEYCNEFNKVYQIWDSNKTNKKSYKFPNEINNYVKKYGTTFSNVLEDVVEYLNKEYPNAKEGDKFKFKDNDSYVVKVINNHNWFYIPEKIVDFFEKMKNKNIILVGGADNECLKDVFIALQSFNVCPVYNHKYIYSAKTTNKDIMS
jgi:hypothetical protein